MSKTFYCKSFYKNYNCKKNNLFYNKHSKSLERKEKVDP